MRKVLLFIALSIISVINVNAQRNQINLNRNWLFYYNWQMLPGEGETVNLPHTYNLDAVYRPDYFRGLVGYVKQIDVPKQWNGKSVIIDFKGAATVADLYINSRHVGSHKGGSTAFGWDIAPYLKFGERNILQLIVNNAPNVDIIPITGTNNVFGGIFRDVQLRVGPACYIGNMELASSGIAVTPVNVTNERAQVNINAMVQGPALETATISFTIFDSNGMAIDSLSRPIDITMDGRVEVGTVFGIENPRLWNAKTDPNMYSVRVKVQSRWGVDEVTEEFGLRYFEIDRQNRFTLNGQPMPIKGVVYTAELEGSGTVMNKDDYLRDMKWIKEMGANAVRVTGGIVDPYFASLCDREGILLWCDLPLTGNQGDTRQTGYNDSQQFRDNAQSQLREMVVQLYNHPSIMWWGLFDNISARGDDPVPLIRQLNQLAKAEDPTRLTAGSSNQDGPINMITDVIGFNPTFGWIGGTPDDIKVWTKQLKRNWPNLKTAISSYGAGANPHQTTDSLERTQIGTKFHSQQWQSYLHEVYLREISSPESGIFGGFVLSMFDFSSIAATKYPRTGINDCGLVTYNRAQAKEAFYLYKAAWNTDEKFAHIAQPLKNVKNTKLYDIKVYSTYENLELLVNGKVQYTTKNDGIGIFSFPQIELKAGIINKLEVKEPYSDEIVSTLVYNLIR